MIFSLKRPCAKCPFRTDVRPYLSRRRVQEIGGALLDGRVFSCHETTGVMRRRKRGALAQHCVGALHVLEKLERPNAAMLLGEMLGYYVPHELDVSVDVFDSFDAMVGAQEEP